MDFDSIYDSPNFYELVLKHMVRDTQVLLKAKELKMQPEDVLTSRQGGILAYSAVVETALEIGEAPIDFDIFKLVFRDKIQSNPILSQQATKLGQLIHFIYTGDISNGDFICKHLKNFIKRRREEKAKLENIKDTIKLREELNKVAVELDMNDSGAAATTGVPFMDLVIKSNTACVPTGFRRIDSAIGGLDLGSSGIVLGYSGGGKTAFACNMAANAAMNGYKVIYFSLEEPYENIVQRYYSMFFRIPYTRLHRGEANMELEQAFNTMDAVKKDQLLNLQIVDLRAQTPVNSELIKNIINQKSKDGFEADLVLIDQLEFLEPVMGSKNKQGWELVCQAANEVEKISHLEVGEVKKPIAMWLMHQLTGKMKKEVNNADIAGFKGIIRPYDAVLYIGKEDPAAPHSRIGSIKNRHGKNFAFDYVNDLEHMTFSEISSAEQTEAPQTQDALLENIRRFADAE